MSALTVVVLVMVTLSCVSLTIFRLFRLKYSMEADSLSTKEMIISPSEPDSHPYFGPYMDNTRLMENEVASPVEEVGESRA